MTRKTLARWVVKNPGWRALSILLAVVIWMNVATEPEMSTLIGVPVQFKDPAPGLEVMTRAPETVQLEIRGSSGELRDLASSRRAITLDFSAIHEPMEKTFTITRAETTLPRSVELIRATPAQLRFRFERSLQRSIPVTVRFTGALASGARLESYRIDPPNLQITGPEVNVRNVRAALTDAIDLGLVKREKPVMNISAYLPDPQLRFVSRPQVTVTMVVK